MCPGAHIAHRYDACHICAVRDWVARGHVDRVDVMPHQALSVVKRQQSETPARSGSERYDA